MERALSGLEFVRNRSEKDRKRLELLSSVLDRYFVGNYGFDSYAALLFLLM